jgi:hypothetical protein
VNAAFVLKAVWQLVLAAPMLLKVWFQIQKALRDAKLRDHEQAIERLKGAKTPEDVQNALRDISK